MRLKNFSLFFENLSVIYGKKFEDGYADLESDVELLMQDLVESLQLELESDPDENGHYSKHKVNGGKSIVYYFAIQEPFDTPPSNNIQMMSTLKKLEFKKNLVERISKITNRLDKFGYKWELIEYNGNNVLGFFIHNREIN